MTFKSRFLLNLKAEVAVGPSPLRFDSHTTGCGEAPQDAEVSGTLRRSKQLQGSNTDQSWGHKMQNQCVEKPGLG